MKTTTQLSPIEQIQQEFQERWGVGVRIDLSVHGVSKEVAEEIVSSFHSATEFAQSDDTKWVRPELEDEELLKPYRVVAFYADNK